MEKIDTVPVEKFAKYAYIDSEYTVDITHKKTTQQCCGSYMFTPDPKNFHSESGSNIKKE
jgi:hypothetical protein